jgi:hypothetical protein
MTLSTRKDAIMTTLTTAPLAALLDRLFAEANEASATTMAAVSDIPAEELPHLANEWPKWRANGWFDR